MATRPITTATEVRPCPHCQGTSWCFALDGGATACYRVGEGGKPLTDRQGQPYRLFPAPEGAAKPNKPRDRQRTAEWVYVSPAGEPVLRVTRYDSPRGKSYAQASYRGGTWVPAGMAATPLYHADRLAAADPATPVYICEGEQAATWAAQVDLLATTAPEGAGKWGKVDPAYRALLAGRQVVILPDADPPGRRHAAEVARDLIGHAARVQVLELPGLRPKGDLVDYLRGGGTREALEALAAAAPTAEAWLAEQAEVPPTPSKPTSGPLVVTLADVTPTAVSWLWPGRVPLGKLTCLAGLPGRGKSLITLGLTAAVTRGRPVAPGEAPCPPGSVLLLGAEDDLADTVAPRLAAAGANTKRVHALDLVSGPQGSLRGVSLTRDLLVLEQVLTELADVRLLVVDPWSAYLGGAGEVDSYRDSDVRGILRPLADLASRRGLAVLLVAHHRKGAGGSADYRVGGSLGLVAACRSVMHVTDHPRDPGIRLLVAGKSNLGRRPPALRYVVEEVDGRPTVAWRGEEALGAEDVLGEGGAAPSKTDSAADWLRDLLADGPVPADVVRDRGREAGYPVRTLERAKTAIGAEARRQGYGHEGRWYWSVGTIGRQPLSVDLAALEQTFEGRQSDEPTIGRHIGRHDGGLWQDADGIGIVGGSDSHRPPSPADYSRAREDRLTPCQSAGCPNLRRDGAPYCSPCELRNATEAVGGIL